MPEERGEAVSEVLQGEKQRGAAVLFSSHELELGERLCNRIVIVDGGKLLAAGRLEELRARVLRAIRMSVLVGPAMGVTLLHESADGAVMQLPPGADAQAVLRAAQLLGPVLHFSYASGQLIDLYRELVSHFN